MGGGGHHRLRQLKNIEKHEKHNYVACGSASAYNIGNWMRGALLNQGGGGDYRRARRLDFEEVLYVSA
jgi:hypothetical protein